MYTEWTFFTKRTGRSTRNAFLDRRPFSFLNSERHQPDWYYFEWNTRRTYKFITALLRRGSRARAVFPRNWLFFIFRDTLHTRTYIHTSIRVSPEHRGPPAMFWFGSLFRGRGGGRRVVFFFLSAESRRFSFVFFFITTTPSREGLKTYKRFCACTIITRLNNNPQSRHHASGASPGCNT